MRLLLSGALARVFLVVVCTAPRVAAQLASEISVENRSGQTFVTWREAALTGMHYRVYRSTAPLQSAADLASATLLGEVDDRTSHNSERSQVERAERTWIIVDGGAPLAVNQGLFVHTVATDGELAFYAVTSVKRGVESTLILPGQNASLTALEERTAPPQPVLQMRDSRREVWGHWVSNVDTPYQPALSLTPSHAFDFCYEPGQTSGPRGLLLRLHSAGGNYAQEWPARAIVPADVDILALSDLHPTTGYTFWYGAHERFPAAPAADTRVWPFTQERVLWTLDWMSARLTSGLDAERVYIAGSSLGGIGGMYLLEEAPERFAAALLRNGNFDLTTNDYVDRSPFEKLYGSFALDLPTRSGLPVLERTNARFMANLDPAVDWPLIRTINGRQDQRVGWASAVSLFAGLAETFRPAAHYFDDRTHTPVGYWTPLERTLVKRTCQVRRDRPSLRFTACTLDDDPGDGSRTSGDTIGTLDGYVDYDPATATASPGTLRFDVFLHAQGTLDEAPGSTGYAVLTPRRTGPFAPAPDEVVHFTLLEAGKVVDEHWLTTDTLGLVHTPLVALTRARREARFERSVLAATAGAGLSLGAAPLAGGALQAFLSGRPGEHWLLFLTPGNARGPYGANATTSTSGVLDARGRADVRIELPASVGAGTWLWGRARSGHGWTPWSTTVVHAGPGSRREPSSAAPGSSR